jgi:hypothetical protein
VIGVPATNTRVKKGPLILTEGNSTKPFNVDAGANLVFSGSTEFGGGAHVYTWNGGTRLIGPGITEVTGQVEIPAGVNVATDNFVLDNGFLGKFEVKGAGTLTMVGTATWYSGTITTANLVIGNNAKVAVQFYPKRANAETVTFSGMKFINNNLVSILANANLVFSPGKTAISATNLGTITIADKGSINVLQTQQNNATFTNQGTVQND